MLLTEMAVEHHPPSPPPPAPPPSSSSSSSVPSEKAPGREYAGHEKATARAVSRAHRPPITLPEDTAPPTLQDTWSKQRAEMSETEEFRGAIEEDEISKREEYNIGRFSPTNESSINRGYHRHSFEESLKGELEVLEKQEEERGEERKGTEWEKEEASKSASVADTPSTTTTSTDGGTSPSEERVVSSSDVTQEEEEEKRTAVVEVRRDVTESVDGRRSNENASVGEWNSLPILVDRLRSVLELSLATTSTPLRQSDATSSTNTVEDIVVDKEDEKLKLKPSMGQDSMLLEYSDPDLKKDLQFLEDLLLSDIETALSRLRETLERIDVAALAKNGAASDPSSKLYLLRLVSSLLSRLQVPEQPARVEVSEAKNEVKHCTMSLFDRPRRTRGTRHTIGVSAEELARARKWLEEERSAAQNELDRLAHSTLPKNRVEESKVIDVSRGEVIKKDRVSEEVRDKDTKDAINQRQSMRDKSKDSRLEIPGYRGVQSRINQVEVAIAPVAPVEPNLIRPQRRTSADSCQNMKLSENDDESDDEIENKGRVTQLAAALRQRAEMSQNAKCSNNKFMAKRSKIKRANTIDIPSYLKLQAESFGDGNAGCISLRRPIHVGDKAISNTSNLIVPDLQPKTENDRKFLALISRNNDAQTLNTPSSFKSFAYTKTSDLSSVTNENWNSRFSNIKTAFDKPNSETKENQFVPKNSPARRPSGVAHLSQRYKPKEKTPPKNTFVCNNAPMNNTNNSIAGFRHAPSSPFRKIEKQTANTIASTKQPPTYHWPKNNPPSSVKNNPPTSGNSLREKARMMFDKDNSVVHPQESEKVPEKVVLSRPPWIEHDKHEKNIGTVTENGKLDYRSFCKQFAPFVSRNEPKSSKEFDQSRQRSVNPRDDDAAAQSNDSVYKKSTGIVEGKISFKAIPEKRLPERQYATIEPRRYVEPSREKKFGAVKDTFEPIHVPQQRHENDRRYGESEFSKPEVLQESTLRGSASVAVQTGYNDEIPNEVRSLCVAPKISTPSVCSNVSVQTNDLERAGIPGRIESDKQWKTLQYDYMDSNRAMDSHYQYPIVDHNQHYDNMTNPIIRNVPSDSAFQEPYHRNLYQPMNRIDATLENIQPNHQQIEREDSYAKNPQFETYPLERRLPNPTMYQNELYCPSAETDPVQPEFGQKGNIPWQEDTFLTDENIQNQDISPETGIVTRYTCAIATVASADSPDPRSEETIGATTSQTSSTPSPSQSWSWPRPRPTANDTPSPDDEIRRHNMLQQSLVRRLQHTNSSMNESRINEPRIIEPKVIEPRIVEPRVIEAKINERRTNELKINEPKINGPRINEPNINRTVNINQSKFLSPEGTRRLEPSSPPISSTSNRVTALRETYEQPSISTHMKPIKKERSPIPNGLKPIDSSDEYLVSCANKSSRSLVLSKSESWHQLALSSSSSRVPRTGTSTASSPHSSGLSKPPKPKSPSSLKLRSKQYEASSAADSVKKMEDKIRRYFDNPNSDTHNESKESSRHKRLSPRATTKNLHGLSRSQTMPGICEEKLRLMIPTPQLLPLTNLNSADVDKVFDDLFEEATRNDDHLY